MKIGRILQLICVLVLVGCSPGDMNRTVSSSTSETPLTSPVPTVIAGGTPVPSSNVINSKNVSQMRVLHQWQVESAFLYRSANFWFSDSSQFVIPVSSEEPLNGLQSFEIDSLSSKWFLRTENLDFTIDENDQILINVRGLQIYDKRGTEIRTIRPNEPCDEAPASNYIVSIPDSHWVVTGHQDSYSDFGLNNTLEDKARLLMWDLSRNSCSELVKQFDGYLSSLSASYDGRYISYSVGIRNTDPVRSITRIYDLTLRKETCEMAGYLTRFNPQNQLAVYSPKEGTLSLVNPIDCVPQMKARLGSDLQFWVFSPSGTLLVSISGENVGLWDVETGEKLREIGLQAHASLIGFSPDGRFLLTTEGKTSPTESDQVLLWGIP